MLSATSMPEGALLDASWTGPGDSVRTVGDSVFKLGVFCDKRGAPQISQASNDG